MARYVVGVSISSLAFGAPISMAILSSGSDQTTPEFFHDELKVDVNTSTVHAPVPFALMCTLKRLVAKLPSPHPATAIYALPLHPSTVDCDIVHNAANAADLPVQAIVEEINHCLFDLASGESDEPWHELVLLVTPFHAAAELCAAEVVEFGPDQYMPTSEVVEEILVEDVETTASQLFQQLLKPLVVAAEAANILLRRVVAIKTLDALLPGCVVDEMERMLDELLHAHVPIVFGHHPAEFAARAALMGQEQRQNSISDSSGSDSESDEDDDHDPFETVDARIGIARADGFVCTLVDKNCSVPTVRSIFLTTSKELQDSATVTVVVGASIHLEKNIPLGTFKLSDLSPCGKGAARIRITGYIGQGRSTRVVAEELLESADGKITVGAVGSVEFQRPPAESVPQDGLEEFLDTEKADKEWEGKDARGALPQL